MRRGTERATYVQAVQQLYLQLRGGGLTLSPLDADRIRAWWDAGIPLELALEGVRAAHAAFAAGGRRMRPFTLRGAERWVAELAGRHERRGGAFDAARPGGGASDRPAAAAAPQVAGAAAPREAEGAEALLARCIAGIEARLQGAAPASRAAYAAALEALAVDGEGKALDAALAAADEAQAFAYLRALERPLQRAVAQGAWREAGSRAGMPRPGYRAMLRAHLCEAAREHGGFLRPSDLT